MRKEKADTDLLQGSWSVVTLEVEGQRMPSEMLSAARIVVKGDRFQSLGMGATYEGTLKLDATITPKELDLTFAAGPEKGNTSLGIYELAGDDWRICLTTRGGAGYRARSGDPETGNARLMADASQGRSPSG